MNILAITWDKNAFTKSLKEKLCLQCYERNSFTNVPSYAFAWDISPEFSGYFGPLQALLGWSMQFIDSTAYQGLLA